jgi:rubrerythrin
MADYIDKNELYKKGESLLNSFINGKKNGEQAFRDLFNAIADMPTVEQKPIARKHGHWDYYGYDEISNVHIYRCSECECGNGEATDYCPYCGSKMDEVTEDDG